MSIPTSQPPESFVDLLDGNSVLVIGDFAQEPRTARLLIDQSQALYDAGVRHIVLQTKNSRVIDSVNAGKSLGWLARAGRRKPGGDQIRIGRQAFETVVALHAVGIEIHAGDTKSLENEERLTAALHESLDSYGTARGQVLASESEHLARTAAGTTRSGGKAIILAHGAQVSRYAHAGLATVGQVLARNGVAAVSVLASGGVATPVSPPELFPLVKDRTRTQLIRLESPRFRAELGIDAALCFPQVSVSATTSEASVSGDLISGRDPERLAFLLRNELGTLDPVLNQMVGSFILAAGRPFDEARAQFRRGVELGDPTQLLDLARLDALEGKFGRAAELTGQAADQGVIGAVPLTGAYLQQASLMRTVRNEGPTSPAMGGMG